LRVLGFNATDGPVGRGESLIGEGER
jgi:hypothetical protein